MRPLLPTLLMILVPTRPGQLCRFKNGGLKEEGQSIQSGSNFMAVDC